MMETFTNLLPSINHVSILTIVGFSVCAASVLLYLLSRSNQFLMITAVAAIYACVPLIPSHLF